MFSRCGSPAGISCGNHQPRNRSRKSVDFEVEIIYLDQRCPTFLTGGPSVQISN